LDWKKKSLISHLRGEKKKSDCPLFLLRGKGARKYLSLRKMRGRKDLLYLSLVRKEGASTRFWREKGKKQNSLKKEKSLGQLLRKRGK